MRSKIRLWSGLHFFISIALFALIACADEQNNANLPPGPELVMSTSLEIECGVDLGLEPADGTVQDFMDRSRSWKAAWDGEALVLTRRFSCGDECGETQRVRIEDPLADCPRQVLVEIITNEHGGSPSREPKIQQASTGTLTLQEWQVEAGGKVRISGRVDAQFRLVFYVDGIEE